MMYLGIDIGLHGGIVLLDDNRVLGAWRMPTFTEKREGKGKIKAKLHYDVKGIVRMIKDVLMLMLGNNEYIIKVGIEKVGVYPGESAFTGFSLGYGTGLIESTIEAVINSGMNKEDERLPRADVDFNIPNAWQKDIFEVCSPAYGLLHNKLDDTKQKAITTMLYFTGGLVGYTPAAYSLTVSNFLDEAELSQYKNRNGRYDDGIADAFCIALHQWFLMRHTAAHGIKTNTAIIGGLR